MVLVWSWIIHHIHRTPSPAKLSRYTPHSPKSPCQILPLYGIPMPQLKISDGNKQRLMQRSTGHATTENLTFFVANLDIHITSNRIYVAKNVWKNRILWCFLCSSRSVAVKRLSLWKQLNNTLIRWSIIML